jgi:hypothetical protein
MYPSAAAAAPAGSSARWLAQQPMTEAAHEEDCICTVWSVYDLFVILGFFFSFSLLTEERVLESVACI